MGMDYMERFHLIQHPLLEHKLFQLRNRYTGTKDFRKCVEEMTSLLCYEATRDIPMGERPVETPFGEIKAREIEGKTLAAVVILRAGLGMLDGVLSLVPSAKVGHIGIYKDEKTGELVRYYCKMPQDIVHRQVLLLEPILATGETTDMAVQMLENYRCYQVKLLCLVAVQQGVDFLLKRHPGLEIYCAAMDSRINEEGYIIPGIGDAGDRMFGTM